MSEADDYGRMGDDPISHKEREIKARDQRIEYLEEALQKLFSVVPAEPPAKGLLQGIEEKHADAIQTARQVLKERE